MHIRSEQPADISGIRAVHLAAFETRAEADLVDLLRQHADPFISLVAEDGVVVGHILFTPVTLSSQPHLRMMGLAPMAVLPPRQRQGIGSALVWEGLDWCRRLGAAAVVVLGHAAYYPRFGFTPASGFGIACEYDVPDAAFMAFELKEGSLRGKSGTIRYHVAFPRS